MSDPDIPKRGRPSTGGRKVGLMVRMPPDLLEDLDQYIRAVANRGEPVMTRPEAVRDIVDRFINFREP